MATETKEVIDLNREYSVDEYSVLPDDGNNYELIEGKLVMRPAPRARHGRITSRLYDALRDYLGAKNVGEVWFNTGFYLGKKPNGKDNVLEPDLGVIKSSRVPLESNQYLPYPDLAVEVWSSDSDLGSPARLKKAREKLQIYLAARTEIAWGINPEDAVVEVYHRGQAHAVRILTAQDELDGENVIPGFKMKVSGLFR